MAKCNTQANDMATMANNWQTPGATNPGRYTRLAFVWRRFEILRELCVTAPKVVKEFLLRRVAPL